MKPLEAFSLPIRGLGTGEHRYQFEIDDSFFQQFEDSPITGGQFDLHLLLDKKPGLIDLAFEWEGFIQTHCDRCTAPIQLPVEGQNYLLVKYSQEGEVPVEDEMVIYVERDAPKLNVAPFIHEFIGLSVPIQKIYNCRENNEPPCDEKVLDYLDRPQESAGDANNPFRDALKGLKEGE